MASRKSSGNPDGSFIRRVLIAVGISSLVLALLLLLWHSIWVLLLIFAGVLLAVFLHTLSEWLSRHAHLSHRWALLVVCVALPGLLVGIGWMAVPSVAAQVDELSVKLPAAVQQLQERVLHYRWAQWLFSADPPESGEAQPGMITEETQGVAQTIAPTTQPSESIEEPATTTTAPAATTATAPATTTTSPSLVSSMMQADAPTIARRATRWLTYAAEGLLYIVIISAVGVYLAANPSLYVAGVLHLLPKRHRLQGRQMLLAIGYTLRWWLIGEGVVMIVIGVLTAAGLWLIGIKLWLILGLLAALFNFVPNFGPLVSFIPAIIIAAAAGVDKAISVAGLYILAQGFEGYFLTPMVQKKAVELPPALTIIVQVLMGLLVGVLGVMLAAPLTAAAMVVVKMVYVEKTLGDESIETPKDHDPDIANPPPV